ncbi:ATP-grasp domain-containing protein [Nonomuraea sp. B12E4]|uniref:ATP-grasp domain-containing protein n=1 Tax=Nonomuraea sp. B12E4 TaxID=3153564 RepID=UPI00325D4076
MTQTAHPGRKKSTRGTLMMVDVFAPTMRLARRFIDAGYGVVRVQSTEEVPTAYRASMSRDPISETIVHHGDFLRTREAVAEHEPVAVITGGESGVELADQLSESLGLVTNGTVRSRARRDRFAQAEAVRTAGLRAPRQLLVTSENELAVWHHHLGSRVVIKPNRGPAGDGVAFSDTPQQSVAAHRRLTRGRNAAGIRDEGLVAQEHLTGTEYAVDTVSCAGHHRITGVWKCDKLSVNGVVDRMSGCTIIPAEGPVHSRLAGYAGAVLDALGVGYGPAHLEIVLTPDGPCLVEAGIGLAGADVPYYTCLATGESQLGWTVDAYTDPERFLAGYHRPYRIKQHVAMAFPTPPVEGVLRSYPGLEQVRRLESFHDARMHVQPGEFLSRTVGNDARPLVIGLRHPVAEVVARDLASVNYLDGPAFYEVAG